MAQKSKGQHAADTDTDTEHAMSMAEVEAEASRRSGRIHDAHKMLAYNLVRYEDVIHNRWRKKDKCKRPFIKTMTAGFFSAEQIGGSIWEFKVILPGDNHGRTILFHEPHPSNIIRFSVARDIGRRLNRHFGWTRATFVAKGENRSG